VYPSDSPLIVVVACFAGDNAAPCELASALPADCAVALVFVEQPSTGRASVLAEVLVKRTVLPVMSAREGLVVEQGVIYVIPENVGLTLTRGRIHAIPARREMDCLADSLFVSLAQEAGAKAIGVILSGGGSDRALGIRAIRRAGGITFAQYPGSARFPNLPISAIDTGCVDFVLRPNELAYELARIASGQPRARPMYASTPTYSSRWRTLPFPVDGAAEPASTVT
jgi:two-component system CheB/CheR fusion protein